MLNRTNSYLDDFDKASPKNYSALVQKQINEWGEIQELENNLKNQYIELNNLGYNYLNGVNEIYEETCINFIDYIHNNYIGINYIDQIKIDSRKLQYYTRSIYEILFVEFIHILQNINIDDLRFDVCKIYSNKLNSLNKLKSIDSSIDLKNQILKYTIAIDLFDNDVDKFIDNFYIPLKEKSD